MEMTKIRFTLMAGALLAAPALAEDAHHPAEVAPETPSRSAPAPATCESACNFDPVDGRIGVQF
jgi:hypothetical protein